VPVVWGAPDIARFAPGPGTYIDASQFASAQELADYLIALSQDDEAYEAFHAWRTERSFADYGDVFRDELVEMIWVGNSTMAPPMWYNCRWCHALQRLEAAGGFAEAPPMGITPMKQSERPAWSASLALPEKH
jgi:hypothetical protein